MKETDKIDRVIMIIAKIMWAILIVAFIAWIKLTYEKTVVKHALDEYRPKINSKQQIK